MTKNLKVADARDDDRAALAAAIADAETARRNLEIARAAAANAENRMYEARAQLEELRKLEPGNGASPDKILEVLAAATSGYDVNALEIPGDNARREETKIENDIAAWRRAYDIAEQAIPVRQLAVDRAERAVEIAARAVIGKSFDVDQMISDAEEEAAGKVVGYEDHQVCD